MAINLQTVKSFPGLIKYLRQELGWPVDEELVDDLTFEYTPAELEQMGLDEQSIVKINEVKQLRPLVAGQPWGIFWIDFEPKKLPITVMRRILNQLVTKQRRAIAHRATWNLDDLLFISAVGEKNSMMREINFAHFHQEAGDLPTLRVLGWDGADTFLKIEHVAQTLKEKLRWPSNPKDTSAWRAAWTSAFRHPPSHTIKTADALALRLAQLARGIRAAALTLMEHESEKGRLRQLHKAFQTALIHDLSEADFADTYAQTITYGLLTAAISRTDMQSGVDGTALIAANITDMVPVTNPFLREMLATFLFEGGQQGGINFDELGIQDVVDLLRGEETDLPAVLRDFGNKAQGEDPVIHFYEHFLSAYNKQLKVQRGVFYTPKPVVSYIVRSVHELLQKDFGLEDGLADTTTWAEMEQRLPGLQRPASAAPDSHFVTILDPATGTATFLVEVIDVIERTLKLKWAQELRLSKPDERNTWQTSQEIMRRWNAYVPNHLLPRLYGYELMMAPYAIAHMKVGLKLDETGYCFKSTERVRIYLTNALEEPSNLADNAANLFQALGHEAQAVNSVKQRISFTVVIGNPPYSNFGMMNKNNWISDLLFEYKKELKEKKLNLDDDFIKFFRLAHWLISHTGSGVIGMITNNTYIDGITHRQMRKSLIECFNYIYINDLHGASIKKEVSPDGSKDENVFDIQQGVCIGLLVRNNPKRADSQVFHSEVWGTRYTKYKQLEQFTTTWRRLDVVSPNFFFVPKNFEAKNEYDEFWAINTIFKVNQNGVKTDRDDLFFDTSKEKLIDRMMYFYSEKGLNLEFKQMYRIENSSSYDILGKRAKTTFNIGNIHPALYRPFDFHWLYYANGITSRPAWDVMSHILAGKNLALVSMRQYEYDVPSYCYFFVTKLLTECRIFVSNRGIANIFPLYTYLFKGQVRQTELFGGPDKNSNLSKQFIKALSTKLGLDYIPDGIGNLETEFGPEDVFHYMYSLFHSNTYRNRYADFLKIDFPRVPLTSNRVLFHELCIRGKELIENHLLEASEVCKIFNDSVPYFGIQPSDKVETGYPKFDNNCVYINKSDKFCNIPNNVWNFYIGGYQPSQKWLKDRRGSKLSSEDIAHYQKIVCAIGRTIQIMDEIDEVIDAAGGWPIQ